MRHLFRSLQSAAVPALLAAMLALTGCGTDNAASQACPTTNAKADVALALVADGSVSGDQTYLAQTTEWLLEQALVNKAALSVATFGGSDAQIDQAPCLNASTFAPSGSNERLRKANTPRLLKAAATEISGLRHDFVSSDLVAAFRIGVSLLRSTPPGVPRRLVIVTDGVATAGCAALPSTVDPMDESLIADLVNRCTSVLPDASGIDVIVLGVGHTGDLSSESVTFLAELSTALCHASRAKTCSIPLTRPNRL